MVYDQLNGLMSFLVVWLPMLDSAVEDVGDARDHPGDASGDSGDGDLDVVQIAVFVGGREVVRTEGAEQQGQEQIQHLLNVTENIVFALGSGLNCLT